jgi:peptidoglycan/LPS O-acetylase OafA/YrhL
VRTRAAFTCAAIASASAIWLLFVDANGVQYDAGGPERWDVFKRTPLALAFATLAVTSCAAFPFWRKLIANPILVFFSLISYNLYLWHTLVMIWLWKSGALPHATREPHDDDHWKLLFIAISWPVAIAISTAITYFFERPILSRIAPQTFAFDWARVARLTRLRPSSASAEKST